MMDDMLNRLKENMDNTVLKNLDFREKNKAEVRKAFLNTKKTKNLKGIFPRILSLSFTCIFIIGISYFGLENSGLIQKEEQLSNSGDTKELKTNDVNDTLNASSQQDEIYDEMTKEDVLTKLLNTVDNFDSASGKFEQFNKYKDNSTSKVIVEYKISLKNSIGGYEKVLNIPDEKVPGAKTMTSELFYNDQTIWNINNDKMTYDTKGYEIQPKRAIVKPEDVFSIPKNKLYGSNDKFRERPPSGTSGFSLFPYEITANYLRFNELWEIEKQNEELLGHNTIVLHGSIDKSIVNTMQPEESKFRFWVDKDTGILLKFEIYNDNGEVISYLHPENLSINEQIDSKQFIPNLDIYDSRQGQDALNNDTDENDIEVIEHADTIESEIDAVLKTLHTKVPFLYEFSNEQLKIQAASMEKYKELYHAYLTYEGNEPGSGVIYVRTYNKDSVVRSNWVYNFEQGEELDQFTLNEIDWKLFEVKNTPDVYLIGSSGDYKYEIVCQGVSNQEIKTLLESFKKSDSNS
jgi:outer membrane lipoprotein-sorting protein